jgi:rhodanese-related sulfurtransferase
MKLMKRSLLLFCLMALLPACWNGQKQEKRNGLVVVNVLDEELYDDCHIKGSVNIPFEKADELVETIDKDAQVVIYCSNYQCTSSEYVAKQLRSNGFSNVCVYEAGMAEWYQKGLPVEGDSKKAYLKKTCSKLAEDNSSEIPVISTQELAQKMQVIS